MEKEKTGKGKNIVIVILILIILGLTGYITYDKLTNNKKTIQKQEQAKKAQSQKVNIISQDEALAIGKYFYEKVRDLSNFKFASFNNGSENNLTDQKNYKIENGTATEVSSGETVGTYTKFNDTISKNIKKLFTANGLKQFLNYQTSRNNSIIIKDNNDNFYLQNSIGGRSGSVLVDDFDIQINKIEENTIIYTVSDYWNSIPEPDENGNVDDSNLNNKSNPNAKKIDNTFTMIKENNTWKVENYTDSYRSYLNL